MLDENIERIYMSMLLPRFLPYTKKFMAKINELISNGIMRKISDDAYYRHIPPREKESVPAQILTVDQLALGFLIFLISSGLSFAVFVVEVAIKIMKKMARSFCKSVKLVPRRKLRHSHVKRSFRSNSQRR